MSDKNKDEEQPKEEKKRPLYMREKRLQKERERSNREAVMEGRKKLFGDPKQERPGNIWGPKFTLFSFFGIVVTGLFVFYLSYTGQVDWRTGERKGAQADSTKNSKRTILERHKDHPMLAPLEED